METPTEAVEMEEDCAASLLREPRVQSCQIGWLLPRDAESQTPSQESPALESLHMLQHMKTLFF